MMNESYRTTFIGICLLLITVPFVFGYIDENKFLMLFGLFTSAGFVLAKDAKNVMASFFKAKPKKAATRKPVATKKRITVTKNDG